jgi:simple sugar transport system permease protein
MAGLVLAILTLQFLSQRFAMLRFSNFSKEFVWGALLLAVMALNVLGARAARKMQGRKNGTAPHAGGETEELR